MTQTFLLLREAIVSRTGIDGAQVVPNARLDALGVDSLMLLELMFDFEDQAGVKLPADLPRPDTVGELVQTLEGLCTPQA